MARRASGGIAFNGAGPVPDQPLPSETRCARHLLEGSDVLVDQFRHRLGEPRQRNARPQGFIQAGELIGVHRPMVPPLSRHAGIFVGGIANTSSFQFQRIQSC